MPLSLFIIAAILVLGAVLSVLWPFLRTSAGSDVFEEEKAVLTARLLVLENDLKSGVMNPVEGENLRAEIARRFLSLKAESGADHSSNNTGTAKGSFVIAVASICLLLAGTAGLYAQLGSPDYADQRFALRQQNQEQIKSLIAKVEERLQSVPDDIQGWQVLAPVFMRTGQFEKAANAYSNLARLEADQPQRRSFYLSNQAEAIVLLQQGVITPEARGILDGALLLDANNRKALFMQALAIDQSGDNSAALQNWTMLLDRFEGSDSQLLALAKQRIAALSETNTLAGPNAEQIEQAGEMSADDRKDMIEGMVAGLAEKLKDEPDNLPGWERLIQSYMVLQRPDAAKAALAEAKSAFAGNDDKLGALDKLGQRLAIVQ